MGTASGFLLLRPDAQRREARSEMLEVKLDKHALLWILVITAIAALLCAIFLPR
jgi:hypothetical protein